MLLLLTFFHAGQALALDISDVRFGAHGEKTRMVLDMDEMADFRVFTLSSPYRIVIDLPAFNWNAGTIDKPVNPNITAVRHGLLKPGISRIVFDVDHPVNIHAAFTLPAQSNKASRLVLDLGPASEALFERNKGKIFGMLSDEYAPPAATAQAPPPYREASLGGITPPKPQSVIVKPLIVIDPGHGGVDPGASGANGVYERAVTLALGKELRKQLLATGRYRVEMTRDTDVFIKLADRVKFARKHNADLFVSLHADSLENGKVSGASIYTLSEKASDAQTAKLAARENRADLVAGIDLSVEDKDVANILLDLAMRDTMNQSKFFANTLVGTFKSHSLKTLDTPHRSAGFAVLKAPDIPSVLIETGFMSNRREADLLNNPTHRKKLGKAILSGIDTYFEQVRKNQKI
ncbi:MAG: N-acetylmuramoyl-L-alanine amidase [Alphaproteobacteria bacterium]